MTRVPVIWLALLVAGCGDGSDVGEAQIDAAANEISADTEALVAARVAEAEARGNEASADLAE